VFRKGSAKAIAESLKRSAQRSRRRKSSPFRSAMSMLTFYINRGGKNLSPARRRVLDRAKEELRKLYERAPETRKRAKRKPKRTRSTPAKKRPRANA
jgi:hypothetical protein